MEIAITEITTGTAPTSSSSACCQIHEPTLSQNPIPKL